MTRAGSPAAWQSTKRNVLRVPGGADQPVAPPPPPAPRHLCCWLVVEVEYDDNDDSDDLGIIDAACTNGRGDCDSIVAVVVVVVNVVALSRIIW